MDRKQDSVPKKPEQEATPYDLDGRPRLAIALPVGLQHVLAMFVGNLNIYVLSFQQFMRQLSSFAAHHDIDLSQFSE